MTEMEEVDVLLKVLFLRTEDLRRKPREGTFWWRYVLLRKRSKTWTMRVCAYLYAARDFWRLGRLSLADGVQKINEELLRRSIGSTTEIL